MNMCSCDLSPIDSALKLAEMGYPVFPCRPNKTPLVKWKTEQSIEEAKIRKWWQDYPKAMIGLPTGSKTKLVVLDIDVKNGVDGFESLKKEGLLIPDGALEIKTPSGGSHFYFLMDQSVIIKNSSGSIAAGVDVRGDGGYIIAPGSTNSIGNYSFASGFSFKEMEVLR